MRAVSRTTTPFIIGAALLFAGGAGGRIMPTPIAIPQSVQIEHEAIHTALVEATKAAGPVGPAATALARVLHPHFVREEEIALPPLGLLARLAAGTHISDAESAAALEMADALKRELPQMLEEHTRIRAAVGELRRVAITANDAAAEELASQLALHAQTEEEVLYPAAILVGDVLRSKAR